jgi:peptidyl-prolyl cis-trans isomerase D
MLDKIREFANYKIVKYLFAIFLIIPFGLFGIDYYFRSPVGGDTVASVGKVRVSQSEFDQAIRAQQETYQAQLGRNFDASLMENPEIRKAILERVIAERLLAIGAQKAGVRVSDKQLAERIAAEPAFQEDGKFSKGRYDAIARAQGYSPVGLDERLREDFRLGEYRSAIVDTAIVPRATLDGFIRLSEQSREVAVVTLTVDSQLPKVKLTEEQVKAWFEARQKEFAVPEQVRVEWVELSPETLAAQATVDPEDVKKFYETNQPRFMTREERRASHILVALKPDATDADIKAAEEKAKAIAERVRKAPATFADVAKKESQDPGSAVQGGDLGFFGRGAMVKAFEDAVFAAKKDEIVGPVRSDFGFHVIRVTAEKPAKGKSLAEATPEIEAELKKSAASRRFAEVAEGLSNLVYEQPTSLKPVVDAYKLPLKQSGWFSRNAGAPPALANPKVMAEIFSDNAIKAKRNTAAIEATPGTLVAARVVEHKPAEQRTLEAVRAEVETRARRDEALKLAQAEGEAALKAYQAGKDAGLKWPAPLAVSRQKPGGLPPNVLDRIFKADAKALPGYAGVPTPSGYSIVKVTKVIDIGEIDEAKRRSLSAQLQQAVALGELESAIGSLRESIGVQVRKDAIDRKTGAQ